MATTIEKFSYFRRKTKTRGNKCQTNLDLNQNLDYQKTEDFEFRIESRLSLRDLKSKNIECLRLLNRIT